MFLASVVGHHDSKQGQYIEGWHEGTVFAAIMSGGLSGWVVRHVARRTAQVSA